MSPMVLLISLLIILVILGMTAALIINNQSEQKKRTLAVIKGQSYKEETGDKASDQDKRRAEISRKLKEQADEKEKENKKDSISARLEQAGLSISVKQFWLFSVVLSVVMMLLTKVMGGGGFVMIMMGITGFFGLPRWLLKKKIARRQKKFLEEFPDALDAMVRLLKAGMPVTEAIAMAGKEFIGPVGDEMTRIYEAQKVGISLPEAALSAARRMPITEMQMFVTGVTIQQQTGASLSEVFTNLSGVIRARFRLKRKVQALSSEAKASAMIIGALPFLVGGGLWAINPQYMDPLFNLNAGRVMIAGSAVWMGIGIMIMKAMINFKV